MGLALCYVLCSIEKSSGGYDQYDVSNSAVALDYVIRTWNNIGDVREFPRQKPRHYFEETVEKCCNINLLKGGN